VWGELPELWRRGYAEPLLQQYDELTFEVEDELVVPLKEIVISGMRDAVKLSVPIEVSWGTGHTWAELEK
jgi:DNA polymerase-1